METVNKIIHELSLWKPQKLALKSLHSHINNVDFNQELEEIKVSIPGNYKFDTTFPSLTFDMATGTGKTKLMAACIAYLYEKKISKNFFVLAPGETIYNKTIKDFTRSFERYVFKGWTNIPNFTIITGDNFDRYDPQQLKLDKDGFYLFIFNIDKFRRKDKETLKFFQFKETVGASFGELIEQIPDLILLMDESHHYRADLTKKSIEGLKPILGLEFTATPIYKKNIIYSYSLGDATRDGIVKKLAAVIRKNDRSYEEELEELKLLDGLEIHERKKIYLEEFCRNYEKPLIKPVVFISTKNIKHGQEIQNKIESKTFLNGKYKHKTIYIHSGNDDDQIEELMELENPNNKKEIVIHVNKLKEGWDVRNIYTIIPLRASISEILVEQTIGRGVRLPFYDLTKEDIEENERALTLSVITYKLKGDNYKEVINKANESNIIVKDYDEDTEKNIDWKIYTINPTNKKFLIKIPRIKGSIKVKGKLTFFDIAPKYEDIKKEIKSKLQEVDIISGKEKGSYDATQTSITIDLVSHLISKLIEEVNELDPSDKDVVIKLVKDYLKKATNSNKKIKWERLLESHRRYIFEDLKEQIKQNIYDKIKIEHKKEIQNFEFKKYSARIDKELGIIDKNNIIDEQIKRTIIKGYKKSLFVENKFDSKQEKWFADILDKDSKIIKWVKNPVRQVYIKYRFGYYYPDFIVETKDSFAVIEVKSSAQLKDQLVKDKAIEAQKWCEELSKAIKKQWKYFLISHDKVNRNDSYDAVISTAIDINKYLKNGINI